MIRETIVTTVSDENEVYLAPIGVIVEGDARVIAPFRPSTTLDNLRASPYAVVNYTDDVRVFAGCLTGRRTWSTRPATHTPGAVLEQSLAHAEVKVTHVEEDDIRPRFTCEVVHTESHAPFQGFNRAQAAVVEAAILVSRLHMLPMEKDRHGDRLPGDRGGETAGPGEKEAWGWLMERIEEFKRQGARERQA